MKKMKKLHPLKKFYFQNTKYNSKLIPQAGLHMLLTTYNSSTLHTHTHTDTLLPAPIQISPDWVQVGLILFHITGHLLGGSKISCCWKNKVYSIFFSKRNEFVMSKMLEFKANLDQFSWVCNIFLCDVIT